MKPVERQKMCVSCDGRVPFEAIACPYCSADLSKALEVNARDVHSQHQAIQDSLTSLYTPPYSSKGSSGIRPPSESAVFKKKEGTIRESAKMSKSETHPESRLVPPAHHGGMAASPGSLPRDETEDKTGKMVLLSIIALSVGSLLFMMGLLQVFFSENGVLRLEWNTSRWFIYCLTALPLLYYGYRKASEGD